VNVQTGTIHFCSQHNQKKRDVNHQNFSTAGRLAGPFGARFAARSGLTPATATGKTLEGMDDVSIKFPRSGAATKDAACRVAASGWLAALSNPKMSEARVA